MDTYYLRTVSSFIKVQKGEDLKLSLNEIRSGEIGLKEYKDSCYIVTWKTRAHSSGSENSVKKGFKTFVSVVEYLKDRIPKYALQEYDEDDLYTYNTMSTKAPKPTQEFVDILLHPSRLYNFVVNNGGGVIYNPYSRFAMHKPFEVSVEVIDIY
jgi:hypothetical protein